MALTTQTMTDEQRKSVALEYLKAFDNGGVTSTGGSILDLFADDAQVYFPKWGIATGKEQIGQLFTDVGGTIKSIQHHYSHFNYIFSGSDYVVLEGTSHGEHRDGSWRAGVPESGAGRWCGRVRDPRLEDPALLHLSRSRLRQRGHRALSLARRRIGLHSALGRRPLAATSGRPWPESGAAGTMLTPVRREPQVSPRSAGFSLPRRVQYSAGISAGFL